MRRFFIRLNNSWHTFKANVQRVCAWLPVIWEDRDYDQAFLAKIVGFKIKRMEECLYEVRPLEIQAMKDAQAYAFHYYEQYFDSADQDWENLWDTIKDNGRRWWV